MKKALGLLLGIAGLIPETVISAYREGTTVFFFSMPEGALFVSVICFVYGWILIRAALQQGISMILINGIGMTLGGIFALLLSFLQTIFSTPYTQLTMSSFLPVTQGYDFMLLMTGLVVIGNVGCYMLYGYLLNRYTATVLTFGELITPLFVALYGWLFLNEHVHWYFFVSVATILAGMYLFYFEERRLGYVS
jgi:drug/metabolite transporter (DMT)-like permease